MPKPLHSDDPNPIDTSFAQFGILPDQKANKGAFATSITIVVALTLIVILASFVTPALNPPTRADFMVLAPPPPPPPPPPPVKPPPPPPPPKPIVVPEPPKPTPEPPKPTPEPPKPAPPPPPAPKPPPAAVKPPPTVVAIAPNTKSLAKTTPLPIVVNNTGRPKPNTDLTSPPGPVSLNEKKSPPSNNPVSETAVKIVDRRSPPGPVGNGPDVGALVTSKKGVGNNKNGSELVPIPGVVGGKPGSRGAITNPVTGPVSVVARNPPPPQPPVISKPTASMAQSAKVLSEPNANDYITEDAKKNHVAGVIRVKIHVLASGVGQVVGLAGPGLGHGLDEASLTVARLMRWRPALDATGHPIDSDITIGVRFQSAGVE